MYILTEKEVIKNNNIENNTIVLGDSITVMQYIKDKSIDMILCDLPYGTTKNRWDRIIPFENLWKEYNRIIKDNGAILLFCDGMFMANLMVSNKKMWRYNIIWKKGERVSGFLNAKKMPLRNHEEIAVFYKSLPTYNPQFTEGIPLHGKGTSYLNKELTNNNYGKFNSLEDSRKGTTQKYPKSIVQTEYTQEEIELLIQNQILDFDKPHPAIFPTQKPISICEYLISTYTNENDLVLDNTMGSGSTILACQNLNRNFIGIEKDEKNFEQSKERILKNNK